MGEYNELYHHGIKGQKWGVRRTLAQLGHLAARGIVKTASKTGKAAGKQAGKAKKAIVEKAKKDVREQKEKNYYKKLKKKKLSDMTNKEIEDLTKRIKTEAELSNAKYDFRTQNAKKFYENVAKEPLKQFGTELGKGVAKNIVKKMGGEVSKEASEAPSDLKQGNNTFKGHVKKLIDSYEVTPDSVSSSESERKKYNIKSNPVNIRHGR